MITSRPCNMIFNNFQPSRAGKPPSRQLFRTLRISSGSLSQQTPSAPTPPTGATLLLGAKPMAASSLRPCPRSYPHMFPLFLTKPNRGQKSSRRCLDDLVASRPVRIFPCRGRTMFASSRLKTRKPGASYEAEALREGWSVRQLDRQVFSLFHERTALSRNKAAMIIWTRAHHH